MRKEIGIVGLGRMGGNIARRLFEHGWRVVGYDVSAEVVRTLEGEGIDATFSLQELVQKIKPPRVVWLMIPAGKAGDEMLFGKGGLTKLLSKGDIIVDGGNSYFKDSVRRAKRVEKAGIAFTDVGFSGGPAGARHGGCLMIGGREKTFEKLEPLFKDLARPDGYQFFKGAGAGHFVKMVHNGIEYGMMQALGEGFEMMRRSKYKLDLTRVTDLYNHGSVIESRLVGWLKSAYEKHGENLAAVSGSVGHTGEGQWTAKTAREMGVSAKIIEESYQFRIRSVNMPSYTGKVLSALREQFGGHSVKLR